MPQQMRVQQSLGRGLVRVSVLLFALAKSSIAQDDYQVDISLAVVVVDGVELEELLRYRQRPANHSCEAVAFAVETVYELVARAESAGRPAESTTISIEFEGEDPAVYIGSQYGHSADKGVVEWSGRLNANNAFTASFVVRVTGTVLGIFETNAGSYRLSQSQYNTHSILCEVDVTFPPSRID